MAGVLAPPRGSRVTASGRAHARTERRRRFASPGETRRRVGAPAARRPSRSIGLGTGDAGVCAHRPVAKPARDRQRRRPGRRPPPGGAARAAVERCAEQGDDLVLAIELDSRRSPARYERAGLEMLEEVITYEIGIAREPWSGSDHIRLVRVDASDEVAHRAGHRHRSGVVPLVVAQQSGRVRRLPAHAGR